MRETPKPPTECPKCGNEGWTDVRYDIGSTELIYRCLRCRYPAFVKPLDYNKEYFKDAKV